MKDCTSLDSNYSYRLTWSSHLMKHSNIFVLEFILVFLVFLKTISTKNYFLFLFLISQHLLVFFQNDRRIIIKLNFQFFFRSNKFFSFPFIPHLLNNWMIFIYHELM